VKTLKVQTEKHQSSVTLRLFGDIDEDASFQDIEIGKGKEVIIDMSGVDHINSHGSRQWIKWAHSIPATVPIKVINCGPIFLDYVNMIHGFLPTQGHVESFKVPYYCESCGTVTFKTYQSKDISTPVRDIIPIMDCPKCSSTAEMDVISPNFFKFLEKSKK